MNNIPPHIMQRAQEQMQQLPHNMSHNNTPYNFQQPQFDNRSVSPPKQKGKLINTLDYLLLLLVLLGAISCIGYFVVIAILEQIR